MKTARLFLLVWLVLLGWVSGVALAEEALVAPAESDDDETAEPILFERVRVVGSPDLMRSIPGSVTYLDRAKLAEQEYSDVHRILSQVPGVHFQEEDGYGLRPNIGMRGSGSERSSKITTMEDGVLIAPAPYAAPSAYYFPTAGRMEGIEVRKGSASIRQGPFSTGGVLNFVSSSIPSEFGGSASLALGNNKTTRGKFKIGDSTERFGWLFETYQFDTEGFKNLDGGGDTGFDLQDYLVKLRFTSGAQANNFQALEIKAGKTDQFGSETYLGLTDADFAVDPFRRYAASREDDLDTDHEQLQARYLFRPNDVFDLTATAYRNDFFRNWRKLQSITNLGCRPTGSTVGIGSVLDDPLGCAAELEILRGDAASDPGDLNLRNNRRDYYSQGLHVVLGFTPRTSRVRHDIEIGIRYHEDEEDRFQEEDSFEMLDGGVMQLTSLGLPGSQANRISRGESLALFVKDTVRAGKWTFTPGARFESIDFERTDFGDVARTIVTDQRRNGLREVIPGFGATYELSPATNLFGGVHRGFAPPGPSAVNADAEESVNFELGYRRSANGLSTEIVGFYNDYSNLLGACTVSSGCSNADVGDVFDGGEVDIHGLEVSLQHEDVTAGRGGRFTVPLSVAYTYTHGEFRNTFNSGYDPWGDVVAGDELPYVPKHQVSIGSGIVHRKWSAHTNLVYVDETRTVAGQGPVLSSESTDSHLLVDLTGNYRWNNGLRTFVQVRNLTDRKYVAARRPTGVRPGIDRTVLVGAAFDF